MLDRPIHSLVGLIVVAAVAAGTFAAPAMAHPHGPSNSEFTFIGGGWGHGTGMSQYGALGRAEAGHTDAQILAFYYDGAELTTDPHLVPDDIDVRIAVHNTTVFRPTGLLTVSMDGRFLDTTVNTLTVRRGDGGWYINSSNIDWCRGFCSGTVLTVSFNDGEHVRVSSTSNGAERFAHGEFQLTPAASGVTNCGSSSRNQYCLVVGEMTMQQYLYGLKEVPHSWPAEALKSQAIAARSYATAIIEDRSAWSSPFDLYASTRDQEYRAWDYEMESGHDAWADQVDATDDTVLTIQPTGAAEPEVIVAYYSASNGGYTAANEEPRRESVSYLLAKPDPFDAAPDDNGDPQNPTHSWQRTYTAEQISGWLADYPFADLHVGEIAEILISAPGAVGPDRRLAGDPGGIGAHAGGPQRRRRALRLPLLLRAAAGLPQRARLPAPAVHQAHAPGRAHRRRHHGPQPSLHRRQMERALCGGSALDAPDGDHPGNVPDHVLP